MRSRFSLIWAIVGTVVALTAGATSPAAAANVIDEWASVKAPPPPALQAVTVDPKTTAVLMLDVLHQTCNENRRPRCVASLPTIKRLLTKAREQKVLVVYSLVPHTTQSDIWADVAPIPDEPLVQGQLDKFFSTDKTDLEKILKDRGIQTVIAVGTAAHGAVLHTVSGAAERGMKIIVPVDAVSADNTYREQYVVWDLVNAPVMAGKVTLTTADMLKF
jgi:nicotinamidase-related amidase